MKRPLLFFCILLSVISIVRFYISRDIAPPGIDTREEVTLQGKLVTWEIKSGYTVLYLSNVFFYDDSVKEISQNNSIGIRCFTEDVCEYKPGQQIALRGFFALPGEATNPGEFNEAEYYRNKGYNYVLYRAKVLAVGEEYDVLRHFLSEVRRFFQSQLSAYLHPSDVGVMSAMLLGDKSNLEMETKDLYREMGVYHILAISGLHVALLSGFLYRLLLKMRLNQYVAASSGVIITWLYGLMIGMPPSVFRAIIMFSFGLAASLCARSHDRITSLAVAGTCLLVRNPALVLDSGVQLSFMAVLGIAELYPTFLNFRNNKAKIKVGERGSLKGNSFHPGKMLAKSPVGERGTLKGISFHPGKMLAKSSGGERGTLKGISFHLGNLPAKSPVGENGTFKGLFFHPEKCLEKIIDGVWVHTAVTFMTLPIVMRLYNELPLYSLFANLCVTSFVPALILFGGAVIIFGKIIPTFSFISSAVIHMILSLQRLVLLLFQKLPGNTILTGEPERHGILLFYLLLFLMIFIVKRRKRKLLLRDLRNEERYLDEHEKECAEGEEKQYGRRYVKGYVAERKRIKKDVIRMRLAQICGMILLLIILLPKEHVGSFYTDFGIGRDNGCNSVLDVGPADVAITVLDMGQGDGICIEVEDSVFLIDCGSSTKENTGTRIVAPFLRHQGIKSVDGWILTHPDKDHTSSFIELCNEENMGGITVDTLYIPEVLEEEFSEIIECAKQQEMKVVLLREGDCLRVHETRLEVLSPQNKTYQDENSASLVVLLERRDFKALFMGDAGEECEQLLMQKGISNVSLLKVGHHGSAKEANSLEFLNCMNPKIAIISCGKDNRYGHPHIETLERLAPLDAQIYRTDECGAIQINVKGGNVKVKVYGEK